MCLGCVKLPQIPPKRETENQKEMKIEHKVLFTKNVFAITSSKKNPPADT